MKHTDFAPTPPMGWNSWDCYGAAVTEDELLGNAEYMKEHLLKFGWDLVTCDIQWSEPREPLPVVGGRQGLFADLRKDTRHGAEVRDTYNARHTEAGDISENEDQGDGADGG